MKVSGIKRAIRFFYFSQCAVIVVSAFCIAYFVALACSEPLQFGFNFLWLFLGAVCGFAALARNFSCAASVAAGTYVPAYRSHPRLYKACAAAAVFCACVFAGILCFILFPPLRPAPDRVPYVISLGGGLRPDGAVSNTLSARLDTVAAVLKSHPESVCIVTGGLGKNTPWPESVSMAAYLERTGVDGTRILQENRSRDTIQNLAYTAEILLQKNAPDAELPSVVIVSSAYHLARARVIARKTGFRDVYLIASPTPRIQVLTSYTREVLSVVKLGFSILAGKVVSAVPDSRGAA